MAYFAELNSENKVLRVIVADDSVRPEPANIAGEEWCLKILGGVSWKETCKTKSDINLFRQRPAQLGGEYDSINDRFIDRKPFNSWSFENISGEWLPPYPMPNYKPSDVPEKNRIWWDEDNQYWRTGYEDKDKNIIIYKKDQTDNDWIRIV
jgi:hypothetical protein